MKIPQEIKDQITWHREADVDYRATVALHQAGKDPEAMMNLLKYERDQHWMDEVQFAIRSARVQEALDALVKITTTTVASREQH